MRPIMIDLQIINLKTRKSWSWLLQLKTNNIAEIPTSFLEATSDEPWFSAIIVEAIMY